MMSKQQTAISKWEKTNPRAMAVRTLEKVRTGSYSNLELNAMIKQADLSERDIHFMTTMVYGVIQHRLTLEYWLKPFIKNPNRLDPWVRELFMISLFQWQYLDKVPKRAVFDEAINIAKKRGHDGIRRMVTGTLHAMDRQGLPDTDKITNPTERLSVQESLPIWIIDLLVEQYGVERTEKIAASINHAPAQSARVNTALASVDEAISDLEFEGFKVTRSEVSPVGLRLENGHAASSHAFEAGLITLQDEAAMLMVPSLEIAPDMRVLDAAAAPGGKTTQIATYLDATQGGSVDALDIHDHKVKLIAENAYRLGVADRVKAHSLDARKADDAFENETFDRILVDAPCSGLGLLRRKPEIRYEKTLDDSRNLQKIQLEILNAVADKLKVGGRLVYGTCTFLNLENDDVIQKFLATHSNFRIAKSMVELDLSIVDEQQLIHIMPDQYGTDGFFIATLERTEK